MAPAFPGDFLRDAKDKRTAVPVVTIWSVQAGETIHTGEHPWTTRIAEEPGWYVVSSVVSHLADQREADDNYLPYRVEPGTILRQEIGTITVQPIAAHEGYMVGEIAHRAPRDGYVLTDGNVTVFLSSLYYEALFGNQSRMDGCELIANDDSIKYIVLTERVTFNFLDGTTFEAEPGMVLFEDWVGSNGYAVAPSWLAFLAEHAPTASA